MSKGIVRKIRAVQELAYSAIKGHTDASNLFSRGLSYEGWNGGYISALSDVLLALNGVTPNDRNNWWKEAEIKLRIINDKF